MNKLNQHLLSMALVCISLMAIAITVRVTTYEQPPATTPIQATPLNEPYWTCNTDMMHSWTDGYIFPKFNEMQWLDVKIYPPSGLTYIERDTRDYIIWCVKHRDPPTEETKQEL